jgi:peroxiredoxin
MPDYRMTVRLDPTRCGEIEEESCVTHEFKASALVLYLFREANAIGCQQQNRLVDMKY